MTKPNPFPVRAEGEIGYRVSRAALASIPTIGAVAQELMTAFVQDPVERRRVEWWEGLAADVVDLTARVEAIDPAELAKDEAFVTLSIRAAEIASRTHQAGKRDALRNVVLNAALGVRLDEALNATFLGYVERFSDAHLRLLTLMADPQADPAYMARAANNLGSIHAALLAAHPEWCNPPGMLERLYDDLGREGLLESGSLKVMMSSNGLISGRATAIGATFLDFIKKPEELTG